MIISYSWHLCIIISLWSQNLNPKSCKKRDQQIRGNSFSKWEPHSPEFRLFYLQKCHFSAFKSFWWRCRAHRALQSGSVWARKACVVVLRHITIFEIMTVLTLHVPGHEPLFSIRPRETQGFSLDFRQHVSAAGLSWRLRDARRDTWTRAAGSFPLNSPQSVPTVSPLKIYFTASLQFPPCSEESKLVASMRCGWSRCASAVTYCLWLNNSKKNKK